MSEEATRYDRIWSQCWGDVQRYGPSHRIHRDILLKILSQLQFETLLEVGCGNGVNLFTVRQAFPGVRLTGTDISGTALDQARRFLPDIPLHQLDATQDMVPGQYDVVLSLDVLEHIEDDVAHMRNLYRGSKKYVVISTLQGRMRDFEVGIGHVRNYRPGELQAKLASVGFGIEQTIQWGWPLFSPLFRDYLSRCGGQEHTFGPYGPAKILACQLIYWLFRLNSSQRGDMLFVVGSKK
ncbi:MAG: methyltransferase [Desulfomonile tiedjei]|nr:methyltransferase [Desulfomonile tiedjei]